MRIHSGRLLFLFSIVLTLSVSWDLKIMSVWKSFMVYFHESFHALAAILTGAKVLKIHIYSSEIGYTEVLDIHKLTYPIVVSAGYLGNSIAGSLFVYYSFREKFISEIALLTGSWILFSVYYFSSDFDMSFYSGLLYSGLLLSTSYANRRLAGFLILFLGISLSLYSIYDISDFYQNSEKTDAGLLSYYLIENTEFFRSNFDRKHLSNLIGLLWSVFTFSFILFFYVLSFFTREKPEVLELKDMIHQVEKGNVPKEIAIWFLEKGIDLNGKPLHKSVMNKLQNKMDRNSY
ncbi:MAG: M50 family metallopeptidase [Leptospiraceae bacterium]|nr:M50 family metallopeptidase [Leptospiraceae bacterium]MCP5512770.1 M50 family metallopeptidase [Leptospiraceae bacterium]